MSDSTSELDACVQEQRHRIWGGTGIPPPRGGHVPLLVAGVHPAPPPLLVRFDGGSRGNPGLAGSGAALFNGDGTVAAPWSMFVGRRATNNDAEFLAVVAAVDLLDLAGAGSNSEAIVEGDSKLVIDGLRGLQDRHRQSSHAQIVGAVQRRLGRLGGVTLRHVPRAQNSVADALSNEGMDAGEQAMLAQGLGTPGGPALVVPGSPVNWRWFVSCAEPEHLRFRTDSEGTASGASTTSDGSDNAPGAQPPASDPEEALVDASSFDGGASTSEGYAADESAELESGEERGYNSPEHGPPGQAGHLAGVLTALWGDSDSESDHSGLGRPHSTSTNGAGPGAAMVGPRPAPAPPSSGSDTTWELPHPTGPDTDCGSQAGLAGSGGSPPLSPSSGLGARVPTPTDSAGSGVLGPQAGDAAGAHPHYDPVEEHRLERDCKVIHLWGVHSLTLSAVRAWIRRAVGDPQLFVSIQRVVLVIQPDGAPRHSLWVLDASAQRVLQCLNEPKQRRLCGWHAKLDVSWVARRLAQRATPPQVLACQHPVPRLASLNIRSVRGKRSPLEWFLRSQRVTVLALQETHRYEGVSLPLRLSGYDVLERQGSRSSGGLGVALAVAHGVRVTPVGRAHPHWVFGRLEGQPLAYPIIVGSVYLPGQGGGSSYGKGGSGPHPHPRPSEVKLQLLAEVTRLQRMYPHVDIVLMGDFNMRPVVCQRWLTRQGAPLVVNRGSGSMATYHQRMRLVSSIDHILVSAGLTCDVSPSKVIRSFHWAPDHFVVTCTLRPAATGTTAAPVGQPQQVGGGGPMVGVLGGAAAEEDSAGWRFIPRRRWPCLQAVRQLAPPVTGQGPRQAQAASASGGKVGTQQLVAQAVCSHNRFAVLADAWGHGDGDEGPAHGGDLDTMVTALTAACHEVSNTLGMRAPAQRQSHSGGYRLSAAERKVIRDCDSVFQQWRHCAEHDLDGRAEAEAQYIAAKRKARRVCRRARKRSWNSFLMTRFGYCEDARSTWDLINKISGRKTVAVNKGWTPLQVPGRPGVLETSPEGLATIWRDLYANLGADPTAPGDSYWDFTGAPPPPAGDGLLPTTLDGIMVTVEWAGLLAALKKAAGGKAPGWDTIPVDFYKLVVDEEARLAPQGPPGGAGDHGDGAAAVVVPLAQGGDGGPRSPLGTVLLQVLRAVWRTGIIPTAWQQSIIVPIPKAAGDMTDATSYRPISLMQTALKLLCIMAADNLSASLEEAGVLCREQGGFRRREECMSQVVALWEAVTRRQANRKGSVLAFIDFQTAFPSVPHKGLLAKLRAAGVGGRMYAFVQALYHTSAMCVRLPDGTKTAPFPLERGLRQGCPLSPVLFNLFINDLIQEVSDGGRLGMWVPGVEDSTMSGLLFADDLILTASSPGRMSDMLGRLGAWATRHRMLVNPGKCGIVVVGRSPAQTARWKARLSVPGRTQCQGHDIPIVPAYKYLGVMINEHFDLKSVVQHKVDRTSAALHAIMPFLRLSHIPLAIRVQTFRATVVPVAAYGGELLGGCKDRVQPLQTVINRGLRVCAGYGYRYTAPSVVALQRELGVPPLHCIMSAYVARAVGKYPTLRTWAAVLMAHRARRGLAGTWVPRASQLHKRVVLANSLDLQKGFLAEVVERVTAWMWRQEELQLLRKADAGSLTVTKGTRRYLQHFAYGPTLASLRVMWPSWLQTGLRALVQMRVGAFSTLAVLQHFAEGVQGPTCLFCPSGAAESIGHLLVECQAWGRQRKAILEGLIREVVRLLHSFPRYRPATVENVAVLLLGGAIDGVCLPGYYWLRSPFVVESNHDGASLDTGTSSEDGRPGSDASWAAPYFDSESAVISVARFLTGVIRRRQSMLSAALQAAKSSTPA